MAGLLKSVAVGTLAGLAAAFAMEQVQTLLGKTGADTGAEGDPATVRAADRVAVYTGGGPVPGPHREQAGRWVHYVTGAGLGALFGLGETLGGVTGAGFGLAYGAATGLLLDETAVPLMGLGPAPNRTPPAGHLFSAISHLTFGLALKAAYVALMRLGAPPRRTFLGLTLPD